MKLICILLSIVSSLVYSQDYIPDFDIAKFIQEGGISKEIYTNKNGKMELSQKFSYVKDSALIKLTTHEILSDGSTLKGVNYFLDSQNKIEREEIKMFDSYTNFIQIVTLNYFDFRKIISLHDRQDKIYIKKYFFYNDKKELAESFTISNNDLTLHNRNIYYEKNGYQINESETYTGLRYKTITKTKLDKNGFPIYVESEGEIIQDGEKMPKQITYFQNEVDEKGNLSKVYIIEGKKKKLIKKIVTKYN